LLRVLAGLTKPSAGSATWDQRPTVSAVQALGYVPQRESVHDRLTTREALSYGASLRLDGNADIGSRVETVLDELGLAGQADTLIRSLSGGERRRAACGLELVGDPPVLLLDEPTSGLDEVLERRLMQLFKRLAGHDRAVLVATHATTSLDLCDEVIVLQDGQTAYRGGSSGARAHVTAVAEEPTADSDAALPVATVGTAPVASTRPFGVELRVLAARYLRTLVRDR